MKNKQPGEDCDDDKPEVKRLKFDENSETESEDKHSTCCKESENRESSQDPSGQGYKSGTGDTLLSVAHGKCDLLFRFVCIVDQGRIQGIITIS